MSLGKIFIIIVVVILALWFMMWLIAYQAAQAFKSGIQTGGLIVGDLTKTSQDPPSS